MRKTIVILFLIIGVFCVAVLYGSAVSLIPDAMANPSLEDLPPNLQEDVAFLLSSEAPQLTVSFSHTRHFYDETIYVSISASNPDAEIYYTTGGSDPAEEGIWYTGPLLFTSDDVRCYVLKAVAIHEDVQSPILTHSYFVGAALDERFSTYVFSISTEAYGLHGEDYGIFANFDERGREWERAIYVEAFTRGGKRVIAQNAGMRVHGAGSRSYPQKALRLIARMEYEPGVGRFRYPFFEDYTNTDVYEKLIISHDTLILRNDGNDFTHGRLRNPLASWIAKEAGFSAVSPVEAAAVFINGEYYGYTVLNIRLNEHFFQNLYNAPERSFDITEIHHSQIRTDDENVRSEFNQLLMYAEKGYFNDDEIKSFHEFFDVDDFLFYYAIQAYIANTDWPQNNMNIWRYTGDLNEDGIAGELDGRWRFFLWDLDRTMSSIEEGRNANSPESRSVHRLFGERDSYSPEYAADSPIFKALLSRPEYAEKFANYICDMAAEHFSLSNVLRVIDELNDMNYQEQLHSLILYDRGYNRFMNRREPVVVFAERRPEYILSELRELFGYTEMYHIVSDGSAKINTLNGGEGVYFVENCVPVTPILEKGYVFDHWLVNGEKRYDENLLVSFSDADAGGVVFVQVVSREDFPPLLFKDTYDTGALFGFTMYNPNSATQNTQVLYLSDDILDLKKWQFPALNIRPGGTWEFVGRSSTSLDSLLKIQLNFNPRHGEVVFLSNEDGVILDWIAMKP